MSTPLSENERTHLALLVMGIFDEWRLEPPQQHALLGLGDEVKPRQMSRLRQGSAPLPASEEVIRRAEHILGIQESLHLIFPLNRNMPLFWLKNRNRALKGSPLEIMLEEGLAGMSRVWRSLDCTQNWRD